jgi:hypothetical protein
MQIAFNTIAQQLRREFEAKVWWMRSDFNVIAQRLQSDFKAVAQR